jgi:transposase
MRVRSDVTIRFALEPVDFRKSIDGLAIAVGHALGRDPMGGEVFLFRNRTRTALKALYWTPNGFVLVYKRLERGRFALPELAAETREVQLAPDLLEGLLEGITLAMKIVNS